MMHIGDYIDLAFIFVSAIVLIFIFLKRGKWYGKRRITKWTYLRLTIGLLGSILLTVFFSYFLLYYYFVSAEIAGSQPELFVIWVPLLLLCGVALMLLMIFMIKDVKEKSKTGGRY